MDQGQTAGAGFFDESGAVTHLTAGRPTNPHLLERIRTLAQTQTDAEIATNLNAKGLVSPWHVKDRPDYILGQPVEYWTAERVHHLRAKHHLPTGLPVNPKSDQPQADGLIPAQAAARQLKVATSTLLDWFRRGLMPGSQAKTGSAVWIKLDPSNRHRFDGSLLSPTPDMVPLAQAPAHFELTPALLIFYPYQEYHEYVFGLL